MRRTAAILLAALLLAGAAQAQQVPNPMARDAANAQNPEAMTKLLSGGALIGPVHQGYPGAQPRIYAYGNMFGTTAGGGIMASYIFNTNSDTVDCSSAVGCTGVYFGHAFGGSTVKGNRTGNFTLLNLVEPTGNAGGPTMWYTAFGAESRANVADGGTAEIPRGDIFAGNFIATLQGTAANMNSLVGVEIDVSAGGLGPVAYKAGLGIVQQTTDIHQGTVDDIALQIANQYSGTAPGWKNGLAFGGHTGWWPIAATGTMIGTLPTYPGGPAPAAAYGVDFSQVNFANAGIKTKGIEILDRGEIRLARGINTAVEAPGSAVSITFACGTNAGTLRLVAYAGSSTTPTVIADNIGAGVAGC